MKVTSIEKLVSKSLFENDDEMPMDTVSDVSSDSLSDYIVKVSCSSDEEEGIEEEYAVSAIDPEEAKSMAMSIAKEAGYSTCEILSVELDQEEVSSDDMGSEDMELDSSSDENQMVPMESKKKACTLMSLL